MVMDLDETMIHSFPPEYTRYVERPYLREFLDRAIRQYDEIVVFTAGTRAYAEPILDRLDPDGRYFGRRFYRDSCTVTADGQVLKDLRILNERDMESTVRIIDNTPSVFALQPMCGIPISSFYGDNPDDHALLDILDALVNL